MYLANQPVVYSPTALKPQIDQPLGDDAKSVGGFVGHWPTASRATVRYEATFDPSRTTRGSFGH